MNPLVSFVVPCYELGHMLRRCIDSILAQEFGDFEILIMDNCSLDDTPRVAKSYQDPRIRYIRNDTNIGHIANFNRGISLAKGRYLWLLAADDSLRATNALGRFVDILEKNAKVGLVFSRAVELRGNQESGLVHWADCGNEDRVWDGITFLHRLIISNCIVMSSVLARKECYDKITNFPQAIPHAGDWYVWCSFAFNYDVAYCAEPMISFRVHDASLTSVFNREDSLAGVGDEVNMLLRIDSQLEDRGTGSLRSVWRDAIARRLNRLSLTRPVGQPLAAKDAASMLFDRIKNPKHARDILARMHVLLGDDRYSAGDRADARQSYRRALQISPDWKTWTKYLFLFTGVVGTHIWQAYWHRSTKVHPKPLDGEQRHAG